MNNSNCHGTYSVSEALPSKYYVWGLDLSQSLQGAGGIGGLLTQVESTNSYAYLFDGNGNFGQMVNNATGIIDAQYEYDAFGQSILATGPLVNSNLYRFSTKYLDTEYNFYYYGYRYLDENGRWLNRDLMEEKGFELLAESIELSGDPGLNNYAFVGNNPINFIDPFGLFELFVSDPLLNFFILEKMEEFWQKTLADPNNLEFAAWIIKGKEGNLYIEEWTGRDTSGFPTPQNKPCGATGDFHTHPPGSASFPSGLDYFNYSFNRGDPIPNPEYGSYIVDEIGIISIRRGCFDYIAER